MEQLAGDETELTSKELSIDKRSVLDGSDQNLYNQSYTWL
jgi:hypothetical protein